MKRNDFFDFITGLFIIQIVVMHVFQSTHFYGNDVVQKIEYWSFFCMPWFYFKSGYYSKKIEIPFKTYLNERIKRLFIPYVSWLFIGWICCFPAELAREHPLWHILLYPFYSFLRQGGGGFGNAPIWFLLSLFYVSLLYYLIEHAKIRWIVILFPLAGAILSFYKISLPLGLSNLFITAFFYYVGKYSRNLLQSRNLKVRFLMTGICFILFLFINTFWHSKVHLVNNMLANGSYLIFIFASSIILFGIAACASIKTSLTIPGINYVGKHSMTFFVLHWPIMKILHPFLPEEGGIPIAVMLIAIGTICSLLVKPVEKSKWLMGK